MQVIAEKGRVRRDESARSHAYSAVAVDERVKRRLVTDVLNKAFDDWASGLVMQARSASRALPEGRRRTEIESAALPLGVVQLADG